MIKLTVPERIMSINLKTDNYKYCDYDMYMIEINRAVLIYFHLIKGELYLYIWLSFKKVLMHFQSISLLFLFYFCSISKYHVQKVNLFYENDFYLFDTMIKSMFQQVLFLYFLHLNFTDI